MDPSPESIEATARAICNYEDGTDIGRDRCEFKLRTRQGGATCDLCSNEGAAHMEGKARAAIANYLASI